MIQLVRRLFPRLFPRELSCFGRTDTGRVRSHNEDSFSIMEARRILLVADGMGGHNAGEVASQVAIETLVDFFSKDIVRKMKGQREEIRHSIIRGFHLANEVVMKMSAADKTKNGMGCTLVAGLIDGDMLHTCHVGDARCYLANGEKLEQITTDHTIEAVYTRHSRDGDTSRPTQLRQVVTRAIGFPFAEDPEYHRKSIQQGDKILLCSDGLWSMVKDQEIHRILSEAESPEQATDTLVLRANEAGGRDNITAVVAFC